MTLNIFVKSVADKHETVFSAVFSKDMGIAFFFGVMSFSALFFLYFSRIDLGRAILLMGAVSILGGFLFSMLLRGYKPNISEIVIFSNLTIFLATIIYSV